MLQLMSQVLEYGARSKCDILKLQSNKLQGFPPRIVAGSVIAQML